MNEKEIVEKFVVKFRKYSKKSERVKKTNQMVIACMTIIKGFLMSEHGNLLYFGKTGGDNDSNTCSHVSCKYYSGLVIVY